MPVTQQSGRHAVSRGQGVLMVGEAVVFAIAAALHWNAHFSLGFVAVRGEHQSAPAMVELIVIVALLFGAGVVFWRPGEARQFASIATGFAIFGVLVELVTIAIGVGPRTVPDLAYLVAVLIVLLLNFAVLMSRRRAARRAR